MIGRGLVLVLVTVVGVGCRPDLPTCTIACGTGAHPCPEGQSCGADFFCHERDGEVCDSHTDGGPDDGGPCLDGEVDCVGNTPRACVDGGWVARATCDAVTEYCALDSCAARVNAWGPAPALPITRSDLVAVSAIERVYALGGYSIGSSQSAAWAAALTPGDAGWTVLAPPLATHQYGAGAFSDNIIFLIGGSDEHDFDTDKAERYDIEHDTWSLIPALPTARRGLAAARGPDSRIYVVGGLSQLNTRDTYLATLEIYDPFTRAWSTGAPMLTPRAYLGFVAASDGRLYAIGGFNADSDSDVVEVYEPTTNLWTTAANMPVPRYAAASAQGFDGRIYQMGGLSTSTLAPFTRCDAYDPATNAWSSVALDPVARSGAAAATVGEVTYVLGGYDSVANKELSIVETYTP